MATTKTKTKKADAVEEKKATGAHPLVHGPRITEKSAIGAEKGIYTFNVAVTANKAEIKKAIKMLYGVTPVKVAITQRTSKVKVRRGKLSATQSGKKAVVYLKKGDTITFI